jgi:dGTPase
MLNRLGFLRSSKKKFQSSTPENDENRYGLNLTYRTLAAIVKYDGVIPDKLDGGKKEKGIYGCDAHILSEIKAKLGVAEKEVMRTIECQIMDIADDIAYSTYDLEDVLKGEFLKSHVDLISSSQR